MPQQDTLALVIAPRRQILRDLRANWAPILLVIGVLLVYIIASSAVIVYVEAWSFLHAAYFTVINVTTVGFGDVTAATRTGKLISGVNAFVGLIVFGVLVAMITLALQPTEFTGTVKSAAVSSFSDPKEPSTDPRRTVADLLGSLRRLLDTEQEVRDGMIKIAVHGHGENAAHVLVEIVIRHNGERLTSAST